MVHQFKSRDGSRKNEVLMPKVAVNRNNKKNKGTKKKPLLFVDSQIPQNIPKVETNPLYREGPTMTKCEGMWVRKDFIQEYEKLKESLEYEILDSSEKKKILFKARRHAHKKLKNGLHASEKKKAKKFKDFKKSLPPPKIVSMHEALEKANMIEKQKQVKITIEEDNQTKITEKKNRKKNKRNKGQKI